MDDIKALVEKADVLVEALPYIQRFRRKVVVLKYGGSAMGSGDPDGILRDVVFMECVGIRPVVIHGGGNAISARLKERGIVPRFVSGLRVTDAETMKVVEEVLLEVNRGIVERLGQLGGRARGLAGRNGMPPGVVVTVQLPVGSVSVSTTPLAISVPSLETTIVKVAVSPG